LSWLKSKIKSLSLTSFYASLDKIGKDDVKAHIYQKK